MVTNLGKNTVDSVERPSHTGLTAELLRLAFPSTISPEGRFLAVLTAYIDESGTHDTSRAFSMAGYIAHSDAWEHFAVEWQKALDDFEIDFFHMAEYESGLGQFEGWSPELKIERLGRLIRIINDHAIASFATAILLTDYNAVITPEADKFMGGPYGLAATLNMMSLSETLNLTGAEGSIRYVYESGAVGAGQVLQVFNENEADPARKADLRLLSIGFENKRQFLPLQAADILAYEHHKHLPRQVGEEVWPRGTRRSLALLREVPHDWGYPERSLIESFSEIATIRAGLKKGELAPRTAAPPAYVGPRIAISAKEFQERWRWFLSLRGAVTCQAGRGATVGGASGDGRHSY